jgi:hypothetical protein
MLVKKKLFKNSITNYALEKVRLETSLEVARNAQDFDKAEDIKLMLKDLEDLIREEKSGAENSELAQISKMNERNRKISRNEVQEAEKAHLLARRGKDSNVSDPFARRKTAPIRAVPTASRQELVVDTHVSGSSMPSASISRSASSLEELPNESDDDFDPFASVDVSILENDIAQAK